MSTNAIATSSTKFSGAIASHLRVGNPLLSHVLFSTYIAALLWGRLYLRDTRVRAIISAR